MKTAPRITLSDEERSTLEVWLRLATSRRSALRVKIVLAAAEGRTNQEIARRLKISPKTVSLWRRRFLERPTGRHREGGPPQQVGRGHPAAGQSDHQKDL